ncbi:mucin-2-like isoform X2 [Carcharodon carcharias]|uniref:mucin-2-like isoform X2 n=1 Tax=Carcharodon carcharias TaxID=13397 RepID=UPI001B7E376A|nr:mucin-2-like isoform X2 [Carcharodon carcharias]
MELWIPLLLLSSTASLPALSHRYGGEFGVNCCKTILQEPLPQRYYRHLKSYRNHAVCTQYLQFATNQNETFCILFRKAQAMKEFVDSRSEGPSKDVLSMGFRSGPKEKVETKDTMPHPTPSPGDSTRSQWAATSSIPITALQGQDRGSTPPSTQSSPPSTNAQEHERVQTSSPSATALPGLERQGRSTTLPSMPPSSAPTQSQGHEGPQTSSPSATTPPGLERQGRSTTLPSMPPSSAPTQSQGHEGPQTSSPSATTPPGLERQGRSTTLPSMPPSSAPTQSQGHEGPQTSSPSATTPPGLERQGRSTTLPSIPPSPVATSFQGHASSQMLSSSVTSLPGPHGQERISTLQSTSRPYSSAQLPRSTKSTDRTSLRPRNIVTARPTPPPNELVTEETRTVGAIDSPSSTTRRSRGPRVSGRDKLPGASKHRGGSGEASRGPGWRVGLLMTVLLFAAATLVVCVASKWSVRGLVSREAGGSAHHCSPGVVTLVHYCRLSETSREGV